MQLYSLIEGRGIAYSCYIYIYWIVQSMRLCCNTPLTSSDLYQSLFHIQRLIIEMKYNIWFWPESVLCECLLSAKSGHSNNDRKEWQYYSCWSKNIWNSHTTNCVRVIMIQREEWWNISSATIVKNATPPTGNLRREHGTRRVCVAPTAKSHFRLSFMK
jgi:hypothetical protein